MTTLRPSFAEREAFRSALAQAYAEGRIDDAEFEKRTTTVESATSADALRRALRDLPQPEVTFPTTVTRGEAERAHRAAVRRASPQIKRRAALGIGAVAIGFITAGGLGQVFSGFTPDSLPSVLDQEPEEIDYVNDTSAAQGALTKITSMGYKEFIDVSFYLGHMSAEARSPKNSRGIDRISVRNDGEVTAEASGQFTEEQAVFSLDEVNVPAIPAMAKAALNELGGTTVSMAMVSNDDIDGLITAVAVEGDEYGAGQGRLQWTADGKELVSIYRNEG